jgi:hypothetical protein
MRNHARRALVAGVLIASFFAAASVALATSSNISIAAHDHQGPNGRFTGKVSSSDSVCQNHAKVSLFRDKLGGGSNFKHAGSDTTNDHGNYKIEFRDRIPKGTYYATSGGGTCPLAKTSRVKIAD